jgi:hypothetical protein
VRQAALEQLPDTNAVHDRLLQSMRVPFSDSEQWSSPVKPPRSQNYVKPHDARTRVHEGQQIEYEIEENRGKTSAVNLKVK